MTTTELPNRGQAKPHLLYAEFDTSGYVATARYRIECPHDDLGAERLCASHVECRDDDLNCVGHLPPKRPDVPEPRGTWRDGVKHYPEGTDPAHIKAWTDWQTAYDEWCDEHPDGAYHPTNECWLIEFVAHGYENGFELAREFDGKPITSPVPVWWENTGQIDDSYAVLHPWQDDDARLLADAIVDGSHALAEEDVIEDAAKVLRDSQRVDESNPPSDPWSPLDGARALAKAGRLRFADETPQAPADPDVVEKAARLLHAEDACGNSPHCNGYCRELADRLAAAGLLAGAAAPPDSVHVEQPLDRGQSELARDLREITENYHHRTFHDTAGHLIDLGWRKHVQPGAAVDDTTQLREQLQRERGVISALSDDNGRLATERDELQARIAEVQRLARHAKARGGNIDPGALLAALTQLASPHPRPTDPASVPLGTDCAHCGHTANWHDSRGCRVGAGAGRCGCSTFATQPTSPQPEGNA